MDNELKEKVHSCLQSIKCRGDEPIARHVSVGTAAADGKQKQQLAVRIRTLTREPRVEERMRDQLAKEIKTHTADVRHTGPVLMMPLREKMSDLPKEPEPKADVGDKGRDSNGDGNGNGNGKLRIGSSISLVNSRIGTLGFFAKCRKTGVIGFVSANHVIGGQDGANPTDAVLHPGGSEYGMRVATFVRSVPLGGGGEKYVDCAFARLDLPPEKYDAAGLPGGKRLQAKAAPLQDNMLVKKFSEDSGETTGRVTSTNQDDFRMHYRSGVGLVFFENQIEVEPADVAEFAGPGDSGALVYDLQQQPVGLLFAQTLQGGAKGGRLSYVNPIQEVLERLDVEIYTGQAQ